MTHVPAAPTTSSLAGELEGFAREGADRAAVVADDGGASAQGLADAAAHLGASLLAEGLQEGDVVGVLLPNGLRWMITVLGINYAGLTCVPLNTWYKADELKRAAARSGMSLLISQTEIFGRDFEAILNEAGLLGGEGACRTEMWQQGCQAPLAAPDEKTMGKLRERAATDRVDPARPTFLVFTSGSTAEPKIVPLYGPCLARNGYEMGRRQGLVPGDRLWLAAPLFFGYGCANAVPVALAHRVTLCLQERFDPLESARYIAEQRCTVYYGLGPMTRGFVAAGAQHSFDLSSLRTGTTGFSPEDKRLAIEELGITGVCSVYGLTEGYGHSAMTDTSDPLEVKLHTQGRVLPTQEIRIVDAVTGMVQGCGPDQAGEVQLRGCVTPGYFRDPEANSISFTTDHWFRTGDLGWLDDGGRLHFSGRIKEVVKVKGITVSPADVEATLAEHPDIEQAYVFGMQMGPDEVLCGAVVLRPGLPVGDPAAVETEVKAWLESRVASYKVPAHLALLAADDVPLTDTGKVSKRLIGERFFASP